MRLQEQNSVFTVTFQELKDLLKIDGKIVNVTSFETSPFTVAITVKKKGDQKDV